MFDISLYNGSGNIEHKQYKDKQEQYRDKQEPDRI